MKQRDRTDYIVVHGSFTPPEMDIGVEEIRKWHTEKGWDDIGYHLVIRRDGTIEAGREESLVGAHTLGYNHNSYGICLVGGQYAKGSGRWDFNYTRTQMDQLAWVLAVSANYYPAAIVRGHRELQLDRECPGFNVKEYFNAP